MAARLPTVGGDNSNWGTILNAFLGVSHNADGTLKNYVNVKDFGAVGDGSTDDTSAIQSAMNYFTVNNSYPTGYNGGNVLLPPGTYKVTNTLTVPRGVAVVGGSRESVVINFSPTNKDCFYVNGGGSSVVGSDSQFKNMTIVGSLTATSGAGIHIFYGSPARQQNVVIDNVYVRGCYDGVLIEGAVMSVLQQVRSALATNVGIHFENSNAGSQTSTSLIACYASNAVRAGYYLKSCSYFSFVACASDSNTGYGYELEGCSRITGSLGAESNSSDGIYLNGCTQVTLTASTLTGCGGHGVRINSGGGHSFIGLNVAGTSSSNNGIFILGTAVPVGTVISPTYGTYSSFTNLPLQIHIIDTDAAFCDDVLAARTKGFGFQNSTGAATRVFSQDSGDNIIMNAPTGADFYVEIAGVVQQRVRSTEQRFSTGATERMRLGAGGVVVKPAGVSAAADNAAALEIDATDRGFLFPRMTAAQRTAISSPPNGLVVYQSDGTTGLYLRDGGSWKLITAA